MWKSPSHEQPPFSPSCPCHTLSFQPSKPGETQPGALVWTEQSWTPALQYRQDNYVLLYTDCWHPLTPNWALHTSWPPWLHRGAEVGCSGYPEGMVTVGRKQCMDSGWTGSCPQLSHGQDSGALSPVNMRVTSVSEARERAYFRQCMGGLFFSSFVLF